MTTPSIFISLPSRSLFLSGAPRLFQQKLDFFGEHFSGFRRDLLSDRPGGSLSHTLEPASPLPKPLQCNSEASSRRRVRQETGGSVLHDLGVSSHVRGNNRPSTQHGLDNHQRQPFHTRRQGQRMIFLPDPLGVRRPT